MDINELNDPKNNIERDELHYDLWESFNDPKDVSECEILVARIFMDTLGVDIDSEYIIKFTAEPKHFGNFCIHFLRRLNKEYSNLISMDTCEKFIDED
jgi:hypothetical protein